MVFRRVLSTYRVIIDRLWTVSPYIFANCCSVGRFVVPSFRLVLGKPVITVDEWDSEWRDDILSRRFSLYCKIVQNVAHSLLLDQKSPLLLLAHSATKNILIFSDIQVMTLLQCPIYSTTGSHALFSYVYLFIFIFMLFFCAVAGPHARQCSVWALCITRIDR